MESRVLGDATVGIFFFRPWYGGGTTTFTAHLFKALEAVGERPVIYRVKDAETQNKYRPFAQYDGVISHTVSIRDAREIVKRMPTVIGAPSKRQYLARPDLIKKLMDLGLRAVIHDPHEFKAYNIRSSRERLRPAQLPTQPICIRPSMLKFYPKAVFIPHPYMRSGNDTNALATRRKYHAISITRIASVKRPQIILEANRLLSVRKRVALLGSEYRMYTYNLQKKFPDVFKQSGHTFQFPLTFRAPVELCESAVYNVDMSLLTEDGGGTQYSQLEAMDGGAVNIMNVDWFRIEGELVGGRHAIPVVGSEDLARILRENTYEDLLPSIRARCYKLLKDHEPKKIGKLYMEELRR
jgi:hypothetical protein